MIMAANYKRGFVRAALFLFAVSLCGSLSASAAARKKHPPAKPIDLNTATMEQLEELPGIGPVTAKRIIEFREKSGPFRKVEDLLVIPRISKARLEKLRPYVKVSPPRVPQKKK
jgi:competence ComEA-like helix-hairpin-helix protein